jgi:AraC-like DNA-binding protein
MLSDLLHGARGRHELFTLSYLTPPWAIRFADGAALAMEVVLRGTACLAVSGQEFRPMKVGDIALIRESTEYVLADIPTTSPGAVVHGPGRSALPGEPSEAATDRWRMSAPRSYGATSNAPTLIARAAYQKPKAVGRRLLAAIPDAVIIPAQSDTATLRSLLQIEIAREQPGQIAVLDRLLDLLLVVAVRAYFDDPSSVVPQWYQALKDPNMRRALDLIHQHPAHRWTVATLAAQCNLSRATFARNFTSVVGRAPLSYLTELRIELAQEFLATTDDKIAIIATRVGYADGYSLSHAFIRATGKRPAQFRQELRADASQRAAR